MKMKIAIASISLIASTLYSSPLMIEDKLEEKVEIIEAIKNNKNFAEHGNFKVIDGKLSEKWNLVSFFIKNDTNGTRKLRSKKIKNLKDTEDIKIILIENGNILNFKITPYDEYIKLNTSIPVPPSNKFGLYYEIKINDLKSYQIIKKDNTSSIKDGAFKMNISILNNKNKSISNRYIKTYKNEEKNIWTPKLIKFNSKDKIQSFIIDISSKMADVELRNIKIIDLTNI